MQSIVAIIFKQQKSWSVLQLKFLHKIFYNSQLKKYNCNSMHSYNRKIWVDIPSYVISLRKNVELLGHWLHVTSNRLIWCNIFLVNNLDRSNNLTPNILCFNPKKAVGSIWPTAPPRHPAPSPKVLPKMYILKSRRKHRFFAHNFPENFIEISEVF